MIAMIYLSLMSDDNGAVPMIYLYLMYKTMVWLQCYICLWCTRQLCGYKDIFVYDVQDSGVVPMIYLSLVYKTMVWFQ